MQILFDHISLTNFKSFNGTHSIDLDEYGEGLHFIRGRNDAEKRLGPNGTGKSTAWSDAITWCLYGKTTGGLKNPDVRPWQIDKGTTQVALILRIGDTENEVRRSIAPNTLAINGKECGQEAIERMLGGLTFELFTNTVVLGQGQPLFFDLQPRDKLSLFNDTLQLERWDERSAKASARVKDLRLREATLQGEATATRAILEAHRTNLDAYNKRQASWSNEQDAAITQGETRLTELKADVEHLKQQHGTRDLAFDSVETELRHHQAAERKAEDALDAARAANAENVIKQNAIVAEINAAVKHMDTHKELGECPTCGQSLKGSKFAAQRKQAHDTMTKQVNDAKRKIAKVNEALDVTSNALKTATAAVTAEKRRVNEYIAKSNAARDDLDGVQRRLGAAEVAYEGHRQRHRALQIETNPYRQQIRDVKTHIKAAEAKLIECDATMKDASNRIERAQYWVKGFKEVRLYFLSEILQELEMTMEAMLDEAGLVGWQIKCAVESDNKSGGVTRGLTIHVQSPNSKGPVKWESWSGGEAQRLRVVGALALAEVLLSYAGMSTNLEVLDEPTQHMAVEGTRDLCDYLADRAASLHKQIWYIDHLSVESKRFASVTTVCRDAKGSRISA